MRISFYDVVTLVVSTALLGCNLCDPSKLCPSAEVTPHDALPNDGQLSWIWEQQQQSFPFNPATVLGSGPIPACFAHLIGGTSPWTSENEEPVPTLLLGLGCSVDSFDYFDLSLVLGDLRGSVAGSSIPVQRAEGSYGDQCVAQQTCDFYGGRCDFTLPADHVQIVIEEAVGGPASFPTMVTPDFRRTFRVDVAMPNPALGKPVGQRPKCEDTIQITGSVRFTLTALDYHGHPDTPCVCAM